MRVGILGVGQLGRMLAIAGQPLGHQIRFLESDSPEFANPVPEQPRPDAEGLSTLDRFAGSVDVLTFESEGWEVRALVQASRHAQVHPSPRALALSQDRLPQKQMFQRLGIESAAFSSIQSGAELGKVILHRQLPCVLKLRRGGYDGKGQWLLRSPQDVAAAAVELGERAAILEDLVPFQRELSILAVRGRDGARAFYPLVENHHERGCLRLTLAPAERVDDALRAQAEAMVSALLDELDYVGVLALELFECEGRLLANEMAPRVHNSGHWTIEGSQTSQFENHLRAICGLPLGSTRTLENCAMLNLLGELPDLESVLAVEGAHLHVYGKQPAPGRKLGHVTLRARGTRELALRLHELSAKIGLPLPAAVERWTHSNFSNSI